MAKVSAKNAIILVDGYLLSTYAMTYEIADGVDEVDVTGFSDGAHNFIPGQRLASMTLNFLWDDASGSANDTLQPMVAATSVTYNVTILPEGGTVGNGSLSLLAMEANWDPNGAPANAVSAGNVKFVSTSDNVGIERGEVLKHGTITDTETGTAVADIGGADVTAICGAVLHIWDAAPTDTYVVKVQHSTNGSSGWSDLITFTADGSGILSERQTVASGTVKAYRRVVATRTGSAGDSFGFTVAFWRI